MSTSEAHNSLSRSARFLCLTVPPTVILGTAALSPKTGLLSPLAFVPTVWAYKTWRDADRTKLDRRAKLEPLVWTYLLCPTIGVVAISAVQFITMYGLAFLFLGTGQMKEDFWREVERTSTAGLSPAELHNRAEIAHSIKYLAFTASWCFSAAGLGEEFLKYLPVMYARRRGTAADRRHRSRAYLDYAVAGSLAFGVVEAIGFFYSSCVRGEETGGRLALTVCERLLLGSTGHVLMAALSALRATRSDYYAEKKLSWWQIIGPSALIHGFFDFAAFAFSASDGNVGWIHPSGTGKTALMLALGSAVWLGTAWMLRRELKLLENYEQKQA